MKTKIYPGILRNNKGQNLVEFALVIPLLLLMLIGIAEFGRAWMTKNILTGAAREAVRMAAVPPPSGQDKAAWDIAIKNRAKEILLSGGITISDDNVIVQGNESTNSLGAVSVIVNYDFPLVVLGFIPGMSNSTFLLSSETSMRREY